MNRVIIETDAHIIEYEVDEVEIEMVDDFYGRGHYKTQVTFWPSKKKVVKKKDLKAYAVWYISNLGHTNLDFIHDCAPDFFDGAQLTAEEADKVIELINTAKVKVEWS